MNLEKVQRKNRKAISPVLATVILIAITLIAAIAIAGFVFGLFGSFTSSAQVSGQVTTCVKATGVCTVVLTNSGTSNATPNSCTVNDKGAAVVSAVLPAATAVQAGTSGTYTCTLPVANIPASAAVGSQAIGSFSMSNGASVPFSGVWS